MTPSEIAALRALCDAGLKPESVFPALVHLPALLSALEEARREAKAWEHNAKGMDLINVPFHKSRAAKAEAERDGYATAMRVQQARADALQAEVHRLTRERVEDSDGWIDSMRATLKELDEARARADAAWRVALEAAVGVLLTHVPDPSDLNESSDYQGGEVAEWVSEIRALPPPSATPNEET